MLLPLYLLSTEARDTTLVDTFTPFIPAAITLVGVIAMQLFGVWNRRRGNMETRAPDVNEIWTRQAADAVLMDHERRFRRELEDLAGMWRRVFIGYVDRVQAGGSHELTRYEQAAYDTPFPTEPSKERPPHE